MANCSWIDLANIDSLLTSAHIDTNGNISHKIKAFGPTLLDIASFNSLRQEMGGSYAESLEWFEIKPLKDNFANETEHKSFGVFSRFSFEKNEILPGLVGFLAPMPDSEIISDYNDVSVFRHHTGSKIMLGPVAFINSSCRENCCYVSNSKRTKVNIRVTKISGIQPGDEITVLYGGEYFGPNRMNCECPHKELHGSTELLSSWTRSGRIRVENEVCVPSATSPSSATDCNAGSRLTKRRRNFGVTYKKIRNSGATYKQSRSRAATYKPRSVNKVRCRVNYHQDSSSASSSAFSETESEAVGFQNDWCPLQSGPCEQASSDQYSFSVSQFDLEADSHFCSTPLQINCVSDFEFEVPVHEQEDRITDSGSLSGSDEMVCEGSRCSVDSFTSQFLAIKDTCALSERGMISVLDLFKSVLPPSHNLPTYYSIKCSERETENVVKFQPSNEGDMIHLCIKTQLNRLLNNNKDIGLYPKWQMQKDLTLPLESNDITLFFVLSSDGVSPFNSAKFSIYPVWLMLVNLPARRRVSIRNLIMASLYGGATKPDCAALMENVNNFFANFEGLVSVSGINYSIKVLVKYVVVDAVMRAPLMNQVQFNGYYGCTHCFIEGQRARSKNTLIYPYTIKQDPLRTSETRKSALNFCPKHIKQICGLRGESVVENLVPLPSAMLIDYMHQVLLGVVRTTLYNLVRSSRFSKIAKAKVSQALLSCKLPSCDYKRQLRSIDTVKYWKASELKSFLLYGFVCLIDTVSHELFIHFFILSAAIRMLLDSKKENVNLAGSLLDCLTPACLLSLPIII